MPKTNTADAKNVDILGTYYSGRETPAGKEVIISPKRKIVYFKKFWFIIIACACILTTGIFFIRAFYAKPAENLGLTLLPLKYYSDIAYYDYNNIKRNNLPIILKLQNTSAVIAFGLPADLSDAVISFKAKGEIGTEKIAIILIDKNRMSNANRDDLILTPSLPKGNWRVFDIKLKNLYLPVDKSKITQIRFDTSSNMVKNDPNGEVYIKDIVVE